MAAGDVLRQLAESNPRTQFTILAGHTHHATEVHILPNLHVFVHAPGGKGAASKWVIIEVSSEKVTFQTRGMPLDREEVVPSQ
jgi:hypothetical protein